MLLEGVPDVSGNSGRFVFFKVSDTDGNERYFVRSDDELGHQKIRQLFEESIIKIDRDGLLTCETLGGAFIWIKRKAQVIILDGESEALGPVRRVQTLLDLLSRNFSGSLTIHVHLEDGGN